MNDTTIVLPIDEATAYVYNAASSAEKQKVQLLFRMLLREITLNSTVSLKQVMDDIGRNAEAQGLTPAILEDMLNDDA
jgi:hypothetical protein